MSFDYALIIAGVMVVSLLFLMAMFAQLYRKAGPHEALVQLCRAVFNAARALSISFRTL